ncbi:MAG: hypothetical protein J07HQW2_03084 [Haloquadratum walsbyi J07HQW2]|uniref:Fe/B12 periplasmic-binding domain-containing protein n=2 Tax=Haloquadratum walsbyi TaxID=293091 RepID=U1N186_9EURY|nr:MAG: hypothetical protein J07HQW2_03084 [Haloquadratum walsbyi J07HQW2]
MLTSLSVEPVDISRNYDHLPSVHELPSLTSTPFERGPDQSASEIDSQMQSIEGSAYDLDIDTLATFSPDLIITQDTCEACAIDSTAVHGAVAAAIDDNGYVNYPGLRFVDTLEVIVGVCRPTAFDIPNLSIAKSLDDV